MGRLDFRGWLEGQEVTTPRPDFSHPLNRAVLPPPGAPKPPIPKMPSPRPKRLKMATTLRRAVPAPRPA